MSTRSASRSATASHNASVPDGDYERLRPGWAAHVRREAAVWSAFHQHWLRAKVPLLAVRYEDLTASPAHREATLRILAEFLVARAQEELARQAAARYVATSASSSFGPSPRMGSMRLESSTRGALAIPHGGTDMS